MTQLNIKYLKAVNCAASTEKYRPYLQGVFVECRERSVTYVATEGRILIAARDELGPDADANTVLGDFIIPSEAIAKMKQARSRTSEFEHLTQAGDSLLLCGAAFKPIDGTFPDWRKVLPASGATYDETRNHYDPAIAIRLHKAAEIVNGRKTSNLIHIRPAPSGCAAAVDMPVGGLPWFGVIMPVRADDAPWQKPEWVSHTGGELK